MHEPVLLKETLEHLALKPGDTAVDLTIGSGGHAAALLQAVGLGGYLIGLDRDEDALARCQERFREEIGERVRLVKASFAECDRALSGVGIGQVHGILIDFGVSREQLETSERGFSFMRDGPLDMRMDKTAGVTAADIVNRSSEFELADLIWRYGEEGRSRVIARRIVQARSEKPFQTTRALADLIEHAIGRHGRTHPATRTFQALRIVVNDELEQITQVLTRAVSRLYGGGRLAVITYHSLEDRIAKTTFKKLKEESVIRWINKKPIAPLREEVLRNPASRSAKLRVVEKVNA